MVKIQPMPYVKSGYNYGATTAREEAMLKGLDAGYKQAEMNKKHSGGSKETTMTVPQITTGASGDADINSHIASLNKTLTEHQENSKFDMLALTNSVVKKGGVKRNRKTKKSRSMRKNKNNKRKTMKRKTTTRK
jgi:hypothetical protein